MSETRTFAVLVDNEPGVLARVIGLFSGRGYNIESLTVTEVDDDANLSRITIVTDGTTQVLMQIRNLLERLIPVHRVEDLTAIHSAALGYAPDGVYGDSDQENGRSMQIKPSEKARETCPHPLVRLHRETGRKALFSSAAYIQSFEGMALEDAQALLMELYQYQTQEKFLYRHHWQPNMLVMWDNRSLLHAATGGYDGYDRLLHRITIADTAW